MTDNNFAAWLQSELDSRNMTPDELVKLSGTNQRAISRIWNNESKPSPKILEAIARALELPPALVFEEAGRMPPEEIAKLSFIKRALIRVAEDLPDEDIEFAIALLEKWARHDKQRSQ